jgi:hypothetical protein
MLQPKEFPDEARLMPVVLTSGAAYARGLVLGQVDADGKYGTYADAGAGGLDVARAILAIDTVVDASGNHVYGTTAGLTAGEAGEQMSHTFAWVAGTFRTSELTGLTAAAVADLGRLTEGDTTDGTLRIG